MKNMLEATTLSLVNQAEFAKLRGYSPSTVTRLKQSGRLVMVGRQVDVEASNAKLEQTSDPIRADVAERHARVRNGTVSLPESLTDGEIEESESYQSSRAMKARYDALKSKADYELQIGKQIAKDDVDETIRYIGAAIRSAIDNYPDQTAPLVAPITDLSEVHTLLAQQCRQVLVVVEQALKIKLVGLS